MHLGLRAAPGADPVPARRQGQRHTLAGPDPAAWDAVDDYFVRS